MTFKQMLPLAWMATAAVAIVSGCATPQAPAPDYDKMALDMIKSSFRPQGQEGARWTRGAGAGVAGVNPPKRRNSRVMCAWSA